MLQFTSIMHYMAILQLTIEYHLQYIFKKQINLHLQAVTPSMETHIAILNITKGYNMHCLISIVKNSFKMVLQNVCFVPYITASFMKITSITADH
jgi:hypothetical protein